MQYYKPFTHINLFTLISSPLSLVKVLSKWYKWGNRGTRHTAKQRGWNLIPRFPLHQGYLNYRHFGPDNSLSHRAVLYIIRYLVYSWPLPTKGQYQPLCPIMTPENVSGHWQMSLGWKTTPKTPSPTENHCSKN